MNLYIAKYEGPKEWKRRKRAVFCYVTTAASKAEALDIVKKQARGPNYAPGGEWTVIAAPDLAFPVDPDHVAEYFVEPETP